MLNPLLPMKKLLLIALLVSYGVPAASSYAPLFVIERSTNRNVVHYDAKLSAPGTLDAKEPVVVYWEMRTKAGRRENLTGMEKRRAYGFALSADPAPGTYVLKLVPQPGRPVRVSLQGDQAIAEMLIQGKKSRLKRLFIQTKGKGLIPQVDYMELYGEDLETHKPTYEKVLPKGRS